MNLFLLVYDMFLFVFWENPGPEKTFRDLLTFSVQCKHGESWLGGEFISAEIRDVAILC